MEKGKREEYSLEKYNRDGRGLAVQNGRPYNNYDQASPYNGQGFNSAQVPIQVKMAAEEKWQRDNAKANQNAAAIINYNKKEKGKIREGKHAAAVAQLHQNDLHSVDLTPGHPGSQQGGVMTAPDRSQNYIKQHLNLQSKFARAQSSGPQNQLVGRYANNVYHNSDLSTSFNPMKDRHLWTMWRTAVNGRIVDEVRQLERKKREFQPLATSNFEPGVNPGIYGKALVVPPLKRFIRVDNESDAIAQQMTSYGQGSLETSQFVYYGLPRVYVSHRK